MERRAKHEALVHMFLDRPSMLATLVQENNLQIRGTLRHDLTTPTDVLPCRLRSDAVFLVDDAAELAKEEHLLTGPLEETNRAYAVAKITAIEMCESYRKQYGDDFVDDRRAGGV